MHVDQRILQQRHTPQGNVTILPTEIVDLPTETGLGESTIQISILECIWGF